MQAEDVLISSLAELYQIDSAKESRSINPENFAGERGGGAMASEGTGKHASSELGRGWKVSPSVVIKAGTTFILADIQGPGCISHIWMTGATGNILYCAFIGTVKRTRRLNVLRLNSSPAAGGQCCQINSLAVCVNPGSGFNCYWPMPFHKEARATMENTGKNDMTLYYQIDYTRTNVPKNAGYFHAEFRSEKPVETKGIYTILDHVKW